MALCGLCASLVGCGGIALRDDETANPGPTTPDAAATAADGGAARKLTMLSPETLDVGRVCGDATFKLVFENPTKRTRYLRPSSPVVTFAPTEVLVKAGESVTIEGTLRRATATSRNGHLTDVRIDVDHTPTFRVEVRGALLLPKNEVRFEPTVTEVPGVSYSVLVVNDGDSDLFGNLVLPPGGALRHEQGGYVVPLALTPHSGKIARFWYTAKVYGKEQIPLELVMPSEETCDETTPRTVISVERNDDRVQPPEEPVDLGSSGCGTQTRTKQLVLGGASPSVKPLLYAESKSVTVRAAGSTSPYFSPGDSLEIFADVAADGTVGERAEVVMLRDSKNVTGAAWRLPVKYTATGVAVVLAATAPIDFGAVAVGDLARRTVDVKAIGAGRVRLSPVFTMEGADFSPALSFSHDGFLLEAGRPAESAVLLFAPKRAGALQGTFGVRGVAELGANCGVSPAMVPIRGIGN